MGFLSDATVLFNLKERYFANMIYVRTATVGISETPHGSCRLTQASSVWSLTRTATWTSTAPRSWKDTRHEPGFVALCQLTCQNLGQAT